MNHLLLLQSPWCFAFVRKYRTIFGLVKFVLFLRYFRNLYYTTIITYLIHDDALFVWAIWWFSSYVRSLKLWSKPVRDWVALVTYDSYSWLATNLYQPFLFRAWFLYLSRIFWIHPILGWWYQSFKLVHSHLLLRFKTNWFSMDLNFCFQPLVLLLLRQN